MEQLELIPKTKHIPQWLADYFLKANSGNYKYKQDFYEKIKNPILESFGEFIGYELQRIEYKCWTCGGTGVFHDSTPCRDCLSGIHAVREYTLKKYAINGVTYHIPGQFNPQVKHLPTIVKGKIKHEDINPQEALSAYIILLWFYNRTEFYHRMYAFVESKFKPTIELIQQLVRKDNTNDELPF